MKIVNGFHWPDRDVECAKAVFNTLSDLDLAISLCRERSVAVQAGGNCGVWPKHLAGFFETVYTFEPDAENFECLKLNVPANVHACRAALGSSEGRISMDGNPKNCGAYQIAGYGDIPKIMIDNMELGICDFLCLDIEGYELEALYGARKTIARTRPVIQIEDKGLSERYGTKKGEAEKWLKKFGYRVVHRPNRDVILACE